MGWFNNLLHKKPKQEGTALQLLAYYCAHALVQVASGQNSLPLNYLLKTVKEAYDEMDRKGYFEEMEAPSSRSVLQEITRYINRPPYAALLFCHDSPSSSREAIRIAGQQMVLTKRIYLDNGSRTGNFSIFSYYDGPIPNYDGEISLGTLKSLINRYCNPNINGGDIDSTTLFILNFMKSNIQYYYGKV